MRHIKKLIPEDRALFFLRGGNPFQFADRVAKLLCDCIDQIKEFFNVLETVEDGKDGKDGKDGVDGISPHIDNVTGNWFIGEQDTNVYARGVKGDKGEKGDSGVWYGTTTPPAGYDVWIDPSGDTLDMDNILKGKYKTVTATSNIIASESPASGMETDVLYVNNGSSTITVTASAQVYRTPNGNDLVVQVSPGMYGEINYTNINGVIYVRGA